MKNYDPRMHTAEHVLNQTMVRMLGTGRCFSSHLNPDKSKCDYRFDRPLTPEEAKTLERAINEVLAADLPVNERLVPREEARTLVDLSRLPDGVQADANAPVRLVFVGDYDVCPCIGAHVSHTGEVGAFRLISHDYTPSKEAGPGVLRLRFKLQSGPE